jgi:transketolase
MRNRFSKKIHQIFEKQKNLMFLTGDLGYNALEKIQETFPKRFLNVGVAEQNMMGVAAGLAYEGNSVFIYSIAPFVVFRCLEQIKLDICIHNHPVFIIGNGGGYGYGIMGVTHHAIEDIACLSPLPNMICWVPSFLEDVDYCIEQITDRKGPAYLRLGLGISYPNKIEIGCINQIVKSTEELKITIISQGPIVKSILSAIEGLVGIDLFTILTIPLTSITENLIDSIRISKKVLIVEEHVERGGLAEHLIIQFVKMNLGVIQYETLSAKGYPSETYGNQEFHLQESGLDSKNIKQVLTKLLNQ